MARTHRLAVLLPVTLMAIGAGLGVSLLFSLGFSYWYARVAYGLLAAVAVLVIIQQVGRHGWLGLVTPLTMTMLGFLYFFCAVPLFNPDLISDLYRDPDRFAPLVGLVGTGMLSFIGGYASARAPRRPRLDDWLKSPLDRRRLVGLVFLLTFVALVLAIIITRGEPWVLVLQPSYSDDEVFELSKWEGMNRYLWRIFRYLPIALAPLITFCLYENRSSPLQRVGLLMALVLCVLFALGPGVRYILAYVIGGIAGPLALLSPHRRRRRRGQILFAAGILAVGLILTLVQFETRRRMGVYGLLTERVEFSLESAIADRVSEVGADQNWSLEGALTAIENGWIKPLWGETYLLNFVLFFPRTLWPGKPGGHWAEVSYLANPLGNTNVAYSVLGELALNFTVWAVPFGMWVGGWLAGAWWRLFRRHRNEKRMVLLYGMSVLPFAFMVRGAFAPMFGGIMYPMLLVILAMQLSADRG